MTTIFVLSLVLSSVALVLSVLAIIRLRSTSSTIETRLDALRKLSRFPDRR